MTDRELLELAAKAAGEVTGDRIGNPDYFNGVLKRWNPLTDDGDALRLAVKLRLTVEQWFWGQEALVYDFKESTMREGLGVSVYEPYGTDPYAANRRAIVRAAAEVGAGLRPFPTAEEIREDWT